MPETCTESGMVRGARLLRGHARMRTCDARAGRVPEVPSVLPDLHAGENVRGEQRNRLIAELQRCDREIAEAEATLRSGYPDIDGCLLWLYDWRVERKLIEDEMANTVVTDDVVTRKAGRKKPGDKVSKVMHEFNTGDLKSSSGDKVTNPKQAVAIGLSEARRAKKACDCADKAKCSC
jgi:hypothetical protein